MRLRILVKNKAGTFDLIWLEHTGKDIYLGFTKSGSKYTYHASGDRHQKFDDHQVITEPKHFHLKNFKKELVLCTFGFSPRMPWRKVYSGERADFIQVLHAGSLPDNVNVSVGLIEAGKVKYIDNFLAVKNPDVLDLWSISLITSVRPWVYITVQSVKPELRSKFEKS